MLELFAQRVASSVESRRLVSPWNIPAERTAELLQIDGEQPFHGSNRANRLGVYPKVRSWHDVAAAIVADDSPWKSQEFCAVLHRHFCSLDWPDPASAGDSSSTNEFNSSESIRSFFDDWLEWHELTTEEFAKGSEFLRSLACRNPTEVLKALERSQGEINSFFVGFLDEGWRSQLSSLIKDQ
jgi:hypothetical protein